MKWVETFIPFRDISMNHNQPTKDNLVEAAIASLVFLGFGTLIMLVFSPWRPMIPNLLTDYLARIGVCIGLLILVLISSRVPRLQRYQPLMIGLTILAVVVSIEFIMGRYVQNNLGISDATPKGWAWTKLNEAFVVICTVLVLNKAAGGSLGSLYVQKGKLKLGLLIGLGTFLLAAAGSFPMATLFKAQNLTIARVIPWIPWLLIYVLANAAMEELTFRGLFLRKLQPFTGKFLANFLVALVFTGLHATVNYSADNLIFVAVTLPFALLWGYIMQKTDSIWGSILFHAGMDIPIMLGIFSSLT